ncbi:MAG: flippase-like domain-containing protein [Bacterioplanes sp.]|nr:flippase-like domain-containing protein [Bacterioplanes sp.]
MLRSWKFWLGCLLLVALIIVVEVSYGWLTVLQAWKTIRPEHIALALLLMLISYWLRALRFYDFFYTYCRGQFRPLTRITVLHNFFNNLLPMRSGEAAFPVLMKREFQVPYQQSIPALLWLRLMDLYVLAVLAAWSLQHLFLPWSAELRYALLILVSASPIVLFLLQQRIEQWLAQQPQGWRLKALDTLQALPKTQRIFWRAVLWTLINWLIKLAVYAWLLQQFVTLDFAQAWLGAITGELSSVLPIHGVAGAGTYEVGVMLGLAPFGLDTTALLAAAVNLHLFVLSCTLLLTPLVLVITRWRRRR